MDIFEKFNLDDTPLGKYYEFAHGYFMYPQLEGEIGPHMKFMGKEMIVWSLNNYLGLANHPEVRKVDAEAAAQYGLAYPMGARMMSGHTKEHRKLEKQLADFVKREDAYVLN
ncbi:MAG TPA: aminotransferase class I/II-fold pyridoxal phosphate-dependent enzyme, partial [Bacteroidales bacterium]|nr:aminotransferase class I/II-fold pyridoxal phosphate-dependent enzyme [Bacteroidales bacterium]